ncbi:MAG: hypothetical protein HQL67_03895 [Magnetococcales bacterium]|nr:hypothetical protein [Magnetococcales bacterium]
MVSTGINGFGRFGLHLLKYWLDNRKQASFSIDYINDETLTPENALSIILGDRFVTISKTHRVTLEGDCITFSAPSGQNETIQFTQTEKQRIPWRGQPDLLLECSGRYCQAQSNREYLQGATKRILISATVADADQTLVVGFNHHTFDKNARIISYGSCIINAFVPLTNWIHQQFHIQECDTTVIHNMPEHQLLKPENRSLQRRPCSLEWMGPRLLSYLSPNNFTVLKTYIPYPGISMIDMRYRLTTPPDQDRFVQLFTEACQGGPLKGLYSTDRPGDEPESHLNTPFSATLRHDGYRFIGKNLYLSCYFDNENSVNRFFDLIQFLTDQD